MKSVPFSEKKSVPTTKITKIGTHLFRILFLENRFFARPQPHETTNMVKASGDTVSIPQQSSRRSKRSKDGSSLPQSQTDPAPAADAGTIEVTTSQQSKQPRISRSELETDAGKINTSQPPISKRKKVDLAPKKQRTASATADTAATVKDPTPSSTPAEPLLIQNAAIQTKKVVDKNSLLSANPCS